MFGHPSEHKSARAARAERATGLIVWDEGWGPCGHLHPTHSEAQWCQREQRAGLYGKPRLPGASIRILHANGQMSVPGTRAPVLDQNGDPALVIGDVFHAYPVLSVPAAGPLLGRVAWHATIGHCDHLHGSEETALLCAVERLRALWIRTADPRGESRALYLFEGLPHLYHPEHFHPLRGPDGRIVFFPEGEAGQSST